MLLVGWCGASAEATASGGAFTAILAENQLAGADDGECSSLAGGLITSQPGGQLIAVGAGRGVRNYNFYALFHARSIGEAIGELKFHFAPSGVERGHFSFQPPRTFRPRF